MLERDGDMSFCEVSEMECFKVDLDDFFCLLETLDVITFVLDFEGPVGILGRG